MPNLSTETERPSRPPPDLVECIECATLVPADDSISARDGEVCQPCMDDYYVTVDGDDLVHRDLATYIDNCDRDDWVLNERTFICNYCDGTCHIYDRSHAYRSGHHGHICDDCANNGDFVRVADTDGLYHIDDVYYNDNDGEYYSEEQREDRDLHSYDTNVLRVIGSIAYVNGKPLPLAGNRKALLFGVELETDSRRGNYSSDLAERVMGCGSVSNYLICKEDSTVSGIEIVTLPADLESHKSAIDWAAICDTLRPIAKGHYGSDNGIHVHINKGALSDLTLGKMLVFVNDPRYANFLSVIAQRDFMNSTWCKQGGESKLKKVGAAGKRPYTEKYRVLNVTDNTAELRMFNSSLLPERILKNVEFCHALVKWCETESAQGLTSDNLRAFIARDRKTYPNLDKFITNRMEA